MKFAAVVCVVLFACITLVHCSVDVWLTVSSTLTKVNGKYKQRLLELNWRNAPNAKNDWVGLFDSEIGEKVQISSALLVIQATNSEGNYKTEVEFPVYTFDTKDVNRKCLGFYIAYVTLNTLVAKNCIRLNAKWMEENYDRIKGKQLSEMMVPGTHNAAAYYEGYQDTGLIQSKIDNYAICQDESVFNQLMYGIRYIDLRVMYGPEKQNGVMHEFWMAHDIFRMNNTLETVLQDVQKFMQSTTKEVVFVDFHRFPKGFDDKKEEKHAKVLQLIEKYLKPYLSERQYYNVKFGELISSGKRVVLGYAENNIERPSYLYPAVRQLWADADNKDKLQQYFASKICSQSPYLAEAAMAELTPQKAGVVFNKYGGLRQMAENVNFDVTKWFRDEWKCANIIATDFFLGNNMIEVAIKNLKGKRKKF